MRYSLLFVAAFAVMMTAASGAVAQTAPAPPAAPGYPPPQPYPAQPGYPAPQPYAAQPGYPAPQPYAAQPGYPAPQPYPPPGYGAVAYPPVAAPATRSGFLAMIFLGFHSYEGTTGDGLDSGLRLGTILGGHLNEQFSLNGEVTIDVLNPRNVPSGVDVTAYSVDVTLSPLLHLPLAPRAEMVVGPKLGVWAARLSINQGGREQSGSSHGRAAGFNLGFFGAVTPHTSLGVLLSFVARNVSEECTTPPGSSEMCQSDNLPGADKVLGFTGAVLF